jgi:hypothetical protein
MRRNKESDGENDPRAVEIVNQMLSDLPRLEREVLRRFYSLEQRPEQICSDLELRREQFLEIISKAREGYKARRGR